MEKYKVINPPNEQELGERLRSAKKLTGLALELTVQRDTAGDELAARRGGVPELIDISFTPAMIDLGRPTQLTGEVVMDDGESTTVARLEATGDSDDDKNNSLQLIVVD